MWCHMLFIWYHTYCGCVIIHTMGVVWSIIWVWWQRYSGCTLRYNRCELRYNRFDVMSRVLWCHKSWVSCHIECILCRIYSRCDVINRVCVISSMQWLWSHMLQIKCMTQILFSWLRKFTTDKISISASVIHNCNSIAIKTPQK